MQQKSGAVLLPFSYPGVLYDGKVVWSFVVNCEKFWFVQMAAMCSNILPANSSISKTCRLAEGAFLYVPGHQ